MKFIEILQEILLGLGIAIMMPVVVYWGVQTFYPINNIQVVLAEKTEPNLEAKALELEQSKREDIFRQINFWAYLSVALVSIFIGAFIKINSLSIGFIGGGIFNLFMGMVNSPNIPLVNFGIFLFLLIVLVLIIVLRSKNSKNYTV